MSYGTAATLLIAVMLTGCGAHRQEQTAPAAAPYLTPGTTSSDGSTATQAPATLQEAEAALDRARAELDALAFEGAPAAEPAAPPPASAPRGEADALGSREEGRSATSPCPTACKAFSSLHRARDAVCRLEQPRGPRCERAEAITREAEARVQSCACPD